MDLNTPQAEQILISEVEAALKAIGDKYGIALQFKATYPDAVVDILKARGVRDLSAFEAPRVGLTYSLLTAPEPTQEDLPDNVVTFTELPPEQSAALIEEKQ